VPEESNDKALNNPLKVDVVEIGSNADEYKFYDGASGHGRDDPFMQSERLSQMFDFVG